MNEKFILFSRNYYKWEHWMLKVSYQGTIIKCKTNDLLVLARGANH